MERGILKCLTTTDRKRRNFAQLQTLQLDLRKKPDTGTAGQRKLSNKLLNSNHTFHAFSISPLVRRLSLTAATIVQYSILNHHSCALLTFSSPPLSA